MCGESKALKLGALLGPVTKAAAKETLAEQAKQYVREGFTSLWASHTVGRGFMLTDPIVTLSVAATATKDVEIGTAILQLPLYQPLDLAHRVLSLHQICGDRLILGVGAGSTESDFSVFGQDHASRFSTFNQALATIRSGYMNGGEARAALSPWPGMVQPPIFYGTWGKGVNRAATEFDGWIASAHYRTSDELADAAARYRSAGGGRAIVSTIIVDRDTDLGALKDKLVRFANIGFDDAVLMFYPGSPSPDKVRQLI